MTKRPPRRLRHYSLISWLAGERARLVGPFASIAEAHAWAYDHDVHTQGTDQSYLVLADGIRPQSRWSLVLSYA